MVLRLQVNCRAETRAEETPVALIFGGRTLAVERILDRWLAPDHRYFKVLGDDGCVYIIRLDMESLEWELVYYNSKD